MNSDLKQRKNTLYRNIPKVDVLLEDAEIRNLIARYGRPVVTEMIREVTDGLREAIGEAETESGLRSAEEAVGDAAGLIARRTRALHTPKVRKVINATGTILHTNLGRAPLSKEMLLELTDVLTGYSNLEYDLEAGRRGERYSHFEKLLCRLTGAEAAMAVNNNASAVLLILSTLAKGGEVVVSRGELVEIGGKFRVPDVMAASGASLVEVGTTNKTHLSDYEEAVTEETKALLKVHTSNYRIVGFTESVPVDEMKKVAEERGIPVIEDLGSGVLIDLEKYGLHHEPTVQESIRAGADIVCFSGDKLLGGPQAGIIIGKKEYIAKIKKNQLTRALRIDKFTVAMLERVLLEYLNEEEAVKHIPVLRMITEEPEEIRQRAERLISLLKERGAGAELSLEPCDSQIGGGSLPLELLSSFAVVIRPRRITSAGLERAMLAMKVPIVPRAAEQSVRLDMRTVADTDLALIADELTEELA
ncbi:MAG: L-seryl-tRNA(Sec) selenium transferase [Lachnospiraceae bacterium]|nr:L-seryl-tRNA(Sec) selenium transferase [Lachnospiraceae bacterium]